MKIHAEGGAVQIPGPSGRLEALIEDPHGTPRAAVAFAHPHPLHGGTMHTKVVFRAAKALVAVGCTVLRFNFRGVGRSEGHFDEGDGEGADFVASLDYLANRHPGLDLWAGGFSFGSWVALTAGAQDARVSTLIGVGLPADRHDYDVVVRAAKPAFLIHGEEDEIWPLPAVRRLYARLEEPKELIVIEGADHLFDGKTREVGYAVEDLLRDFAAVAGHDREARDA